MRTRGLAFLCLAMTGCITTHATLVDPTGGDANFGQIGVGITIH